MVALCCPVFRGVPKPGVVAAHSLYPALVVAASLVASLFPAACQAQLTFNPGAGMGVTQPIHGRLEFLNQITPDATEDGARLRGDINFFLEPGHEYDYFNLGFGRAFSVGPLPVNVSSHLFNDMKWVIGGGTLAAPHVTVRTNVDVYVDLGDQLVEIPTLGGWAQQTLEGNGFSLFQGILGGEDFILAPGYDYRLNFQLEVTADTSALNGDDPPAVVTLEFGGITAYQGLGAGLNHTIVAPEPSSCVLMAFGVTSLAMAASRRKHLGAGRYGLLL